jgi:hypothetical protein
VYYLTHPAIEYRHAIDPAMVLLGVAGLEHRLRRLAGAPSVTPAAENIDECAAD